MVSVNAQNSHGAKLKKLVCAMLEEDPVVLTITCVLPLPTTEPGAKLQVLMLPAGAIEQDAGVKLTVPE